MAKDKGKSAAQIARENVSRLRHYIDTTPIIDVPQNQYKKASRQRICKKLGITYSTVGSNTDLANLFNQLDTNICSVKTNAGLGTSKDIRQLQSRIKALEGQVHSLIAENESLRLQIRRYMHFETTGRMARS